MSSSPKTPPAACLHCEQPLPPHAPLSAFCCTGCEAAYHLLKDSGLLHYYELRQGTGVPAAAAAAPFTWLEPLLEAARARAGQGPVRLSLDVQGIHCAACCWLLERLFYRLPGALSLDVNPGLGRLDICWREGEFPLLSYLEEIARLGYPTGPAHKQPDAPLDDLVIRLGVCAAIAMNSMIFSAALYFGLSAESEPAIFRIFTQANWLLSILAVWVGGSVFVRSAVAAARRGVLHMDAPIALGILLAFTGSTAALFTAGGQAAYFDTLNIFITLMLTGRLLQRRVIHHNRRLLLDDSAVAGLFVRRVGPGGQVAVAPASAVRERDELLLAPAELLPVAARLLVPQAEFSLAWIDGEPEPRAFCAGDLVPAGAHNAGAHALRLQAAEDFRASALRELLQAPRATSEQPPGPEFWLRLSRYYVAAVLVLAGMAAWCWRHAGPVRALEVVVAVLVVTCPCALGLATPLAYELAQAWLRRQGIFVRTLTFLDRALRVRKVIFDKTGTLTLNELALDDPAALRALDDARQRVLYQMVARSNHPKSRALLLALRGALPVADVPPFDPSLVVREEAGDGLSTSAAGHAYRLGRSPDDDQGALGFTEDGAVLARFWFREELQPDALAQVRALEAMGLSTWLLSGDEPGRVAALARRLGLPVEAARGGLSPQDKAAVVRALDERDTLMIGDGINDAPAFSAAFCAGTPAVDRPTLPARADFYYMGRGVGPIAEALQVARQTRRVIRRNLALALGYNVWAVGLAFAGVMSPLWCALAMPASSLLIIFHTLMGCRYERHLLDPLRQPDPGALRRPALRVLLPAAGPRAHRSALALAAAGGARPLPAGAEGTVAP